MVSIKEKSYSFKVLIFTGVIQSTLQVSLDKILLMEVKSLLCLVLRIIVSSIISSYMKNLISNRENSPSLKLSLHAS